MHNWQDYVLAAGSIVFTIALIPSLTSKNKPAVSTSLLTGVVLIVFAFTYLTLHLWFSMVAISINAVAWLALATQKFHQQKR